MIFAHLDFKIVILLYLQMWYSDLELVGVFREQEGIGVLGPLW